jgi:hypothetical protein
LCENKDGSWIVGGPKADANWILPKRLSHDSRHLEKQLANRIRLGAGGLWHFSSSGDYGLRAYEVARLTLDGVDWKHERLPVLERKAGHATAYPLAGVLGEVLIDYLKRGRPETQDRHLFFRAVAPQAPISAAAVPLTTLSGSCIDVVLRVEGVAVSH